jgi:integral membrane protein (TIGR01906 family)
MHLKWEVVNWVAAIALVILLVTTNVRVAANSLWLYEQLFDRNQVPERTGITISELRNISTTIQEYFATDTEPLVVVATINDTHVNLFGSDEASHMADVKQLFVKTYQVQALSALALGCAFVISAGVRKRRALDMLALWLSRGSVIATGAIAIIGIASVVAFQQVFLLFHYIGFPQGNFTFSSQTDYLVRVFPTGFWSDITFVIAMMTIIEAVVLWTAIWIARRYQR